MDIEYPIRIVLADDHPLVRTGLRLSLEANRGVEIIAEAGDGESALSHILKLSPDVAIVDIDMPKLDGLRVARQVRAHSLKTKIILLTFHAEAIYLRAAFESGAHGYLLKDSGPEDVLGALRAVLSGQNYVSPSMTHHLVNPQSAEEENGTMAKLSPAERGVMKLIAEGKSSKEIGDDLGINYRTVDNHRTNIYRKLKLEGANSLLRFALQHKTEF